MNALFVILLTTLPTSIQAELNLDLRAIKYVERNGKCFVDVFLPKIEKEEPLTNFFVRQTFKSECYDHHDARSFALLPNENEGYYFIGCFYYKKGQVVKCEVFKDDKFVPEVDVSCDNLDLSSTENVNVHIAPRKIRILSVSYINDSIGCIVEKADDGYVSQKFNEKGRTFFQYNAVTKHDADFYYEHNPLRYFLFGKIHIYSWDVGQYGIRDQPKTSEKHTNWTQIYDYVFDNNQEPGKVELPFSGTFYGIKYVSRENGECFVVITDVRNPDKVRKIKIDCYPRDTVASFGIYPISDEKYGLRACFLEYFNVIPVISCRHLENDQFVEDFTHSIQECYFVAGSIDSEKCTYYENTDIPPNIMLGSFTGHSTYLNGILIDYARNSCQLTILNHKVVEEIQDTAEIFGRGFDVIRDEFLVRSELPFDLQSQKNLANYSPIMSTGSNVFFKGVEGKFVVFDPRGKSNNFTGDYDSVIDDFFIKLI